MEKTEMTLGERIAHWRNQQGMTQEEFADAMQISRGSQQNYEKDKRSPDVDYLKKLRQAGCPIGWLFGDPWLSIDSGAQLSEQERELIGLYRSVKGEDQAVLVHVARTFAARSEPT